MITDNVAKDLNDLCIKCSDFASNEGRLPSQVDEFFQNFDQTILMLQSISKKYRNIDLEAGILSNYILLKLYTSENNLTLSEGKINKYAENFNVISNSLFPRDKFSKKVKVTQWTYYFHCIQILWFIIRDEVEKGKRLLNDIESFEITEDDNDDLNFMTTTLGFVNQSFIHINILDDLLTLKSALSVSIDFLNGDYTRCIDNITKNNNLEGRWKIIAGLCYYKQENFTNCISLLREMSTLENAISENFKYSVLILLGNCCVKINNWEQALCFWFNALQISAHPTVLYNFSCYYFFKKDEVKELEMLNLLYNQAVEKNENFFNEDDRDLNSLIYKKLDLKIPDIDSFNYYSPVGISYVIASKYFDLEKYEEAADYLCKLFGHLEEHSDQHPLQEGICLLEAKLLLIHCLIKCDDLEEALEICSSMLEEESEKDSDDLFGDNFNDNSVKDKNLIITEFYKAVVQFKMKKNTKAFKSFDRVIENLIDIISNNSFTIKTKSISFLFTHVPYSLEDILSKSYNFVGYLHYLNGDKELSVNCFRSGSMASSRDKTIGNNYLFLLKETNKIDELCKKSPATPEKILEPNL